MTQLAPGRLQDVRVLRSRSSFLMNYVFCVYYLDDDTKLGRKYRLSFSSFFPSPCCCHLPPPAPAPPSPLSAPSPFGAMLRLLPLTQADGCPGLTAEKAIYRRTQQKQHSMIFLNTSSITKAFLLQSVRHCSSVKDSQ